jgi:hypothetical protein
VSKRKPTSKSQSSNNRLLGRLRLRMSISNSRTSARHLHNPRRRTKRGRLRRVFCRR